MNNRKIYTPEGFNDILHNECFSKRNIENNIRRLFRISGYKEIESPTVEYYDVFYKENDLISQETMFKFVDQYGRILVLRPDMTIPSARITATKFKEQKFPLKHFYIGNTYKYDEIGGGKQKEFTQAGVEIFGVDKPEADAEVIISAINALKTAGLEKFQIDIGQIDFFKGLIEEANLSEESVEKVRLLIDRKDYFGVEKVISQYSIRDEAKQLILDLPKLFGSVQVIDKVEKITKNERAYNALENLRSIIEIIDDYGLSDYVSVDLGLVPNFNYYSGAVFKGFTYGVGFPILSGGRYNDILANFGDNRSATGFALGINLIMMALDRQNIKAEKPQTDSIVCYNNSGRKMAFKIVEQLRKQGLTIELDLTGRELEYLKEYAKENQIGGMIFVSGAEDVEIHNLENDSVTKTSITELIKSF